MMKLLHPSEFMAWINCSVNHLWFKSGMKILICCFAKVAAFAEIQFSFVVYIQAGKSSRREEIITSFRIGSIVVWIIFGLDQG